MLFVMRGFVETAANLTAKFGIQGGNSRSDLRGSPGRLLTAGPPLPESLPNGQQTHGRVRKMGSPILPA